MRKLSGVRKAAALAVPLAVASCAAQSRPAPMVEVMIPAPEPQGGAPGAEPPRRQQERAELTLLKTGDVFLAYVSVPQDGTMRDLDDARVDFSYSRPGGRWAPIPGCAAVSVCDASGIIRRSPFGLIVRATYAGHGTASSTFPIPASGCPQPF